MAKKKQPGQPQKTKYIYVFCDKNNPAMLKVGDAYDVFKRFHDETRTVSPISGQYQLMDWWEAKDNQGKKFRDHAVHEVLKNSGYLTTNINKDEKKAILKSLLDPLEQNSVSSKAGSEWFIIDTDGDIDAAVDIVGQAVTAVIEGRKIILKEKQTFKMRDEQRECCEMTAAYMLKHANDNAPCRFLWNCKMRFGKTFAAYQLALEMGWKRILVLTFKPVVLDSWRTDLLNHNNFENWQFVDKDTNEIEKSKNMVAFYSFQYLMTGKEGKKWSDRDIENSKEVRNRIKDTIGGNWDCVILDEYHFGAWRHIGKLLSSDYLTKEEKDSLKKMKSEADQFEAENNNLSAKFSIEELQNAGFKSHNYLYLSGTPFRALTNGEFCADQIFNWTYLDEQKKKDEKKNSEEYKQYEWLPNVELYTYEIASNVKMEMNSAGKNEFDLNAFFEVERDDTGKKMDEFKKKEDVKDWLSTLQKRGRRCVGDDRCYPLTYMSGKHLVWFMPDVASCRAMKKLLDECEIGNSYDIICCAGNEAGIGYDALRPVKTAIAIAGLHKKGSITLTCGKLLTGVTIPQWEGIFMLCNCKSAENYLQSAFRVQSSWKKGNKKTCCIFDFAPVRAIRMVYKMSIQSGQSHGEEERDYRGYITNFLRYMPILAYENDGMKSMSVDDIMREIANITTPQDIHKQWSIPELFSTDEALINRILSKKSLLGKLKTLGLPSEYHGKKKQATFEDVEINDDGGATEEPKRHLQSDSNGEESDHEGYDESEGLSKEDRLREALQAKLKFIAERLRIYMYLTDYPEMQYSDILNPTCKFKQDCDEMFKLSMGYLSDCDKQFTLDDLQEICRLGLINEEELNLAVHSFYEIEEKQFRNACIDRCKYLSRNDED